MKFNVEYNDQNLEIEAESAVQAIIKIMDFNYNNSNNIEFEITKLKDSN